MFNKKISQKIMNNNNNPLKLYQYSIIQTNTVIKLHQNSSKILKQL